MSSIIQETTIEIEGILFSIVHEGKWIGLVCEEWPSLASNGESIEEASAMMHELIADARRLFLSRQPSGYNNESKTFAEFLLRHSAV